MKSKIIVGSIALAMSVSAAFGMTSYTTKSGDTLWKIGHSHHVRGISHAKMVDAIQNLNPNAFASGSLKSGVSLKIPTTKAEVTQNLNSAKTSDQTAPATAETTAVASDKTTASDASAVATAAPADASATPAATTTDAASTSANAGNISAISS